MVRSEKRWIYSKQFQYVILDEGQVIRSTTSKRSRDIVPLLQQAKYSIVLSGTPMSTGVIDFYMLVTAIQPRLFQSEEDFTDQFCFINEMVTGSGFVVKKPIGNKNIKRLGTVLKKYILFRYSKEHEYRDAVRMGIRPTFPPKYRFLNWVSVREEHKRLMENDLKEWKKLKADLKAEKKKFLASGQVKGRKTYREVAINDFNQAANAKYSRIEKAMSKIEAEYIKPMIEPIVRCLAERKEKALFFCSTMEMFHMVLQELERLHVLYKYIEGKSKASARSETIQVFNDPSSSYQITVLSIMAACSGISLTGANHVFFLELDPNPDITLQAEDRIHRANQPMNCYVHYFVIPNSVDQFNWDMFVSKVKVLKQILDEFEVHTDDADKSVPDSLLKHEKALTRQSAQQNTLSWMCVEEDDDGYEGEEKKQEEQSRFEAEHKSNEPAPPSQQWIVPVQHFLEFNTLHPIRVPIC